MYLMHSEQWHIYNDTLTNIFQRLEVVLGRVFRKKFLDGVWALEKVTFRVGVVCERLNIFMGNKSGGRGMGSERCLK